jgi:hypothetical protein
MEINITQFVRSQFNSLRYYSASQAESGPTAGADTWAHCKEQAEDWGARLLPGQDEIDAARDSISGFGAWKAEDSVMTDDTETRALVLQFIAGDLRECGWTSAHPGDVERAQVREDQESGRVGSTVFCELDEASGEIFWYAQISE